MGLEFHLFLPQMRMPLETIVERAVAAEEAGFTGIALMDHLAPPLAEDKPMWEAMTTAAWLLAHTRRLTVGHLVLCDAFRHPAILARQAVTLDHASGGRFELGLGWGSVPAELDSYGVGTTAAAPRVRRMAETLTLLERFWSGEPFDFDGEFFTIRGAQQLPRPLSRIPVVIGGAGPKTLALVAAHADWWNLPIYALDRLAELRPHAGSARASVQEMIALVPAGAGRAARAALTDATLARHSAMRRTLRVADAPELVEHYDALAEQGVERAYVWFADFAAPETLAVFGRDVIARVPTGGLLAPHRLPHPGPSRPASPCFSWRGSPTSPSSA